MSENNSKKKVLNRLKIENMRLVKRKDWLLLWHPQLYGRLC